MVTSSVFLSTARYEAIDGMRVRPCAACLGWYCGDLSLSSLSRFHTAASAVNSEPSWYLALALVALVGLAGGERNVGSGHADAQRALGESLE